MTEEWQGLVTLLLFLVGAYFAGRGDGERAARAEYEPLFQRMKALIEEDDHAD